MSNIFDWKGDFWNTTKVDGMGLFRGVIPVEIINNFECLLSQIFDYEIGFVN